MSVIESVIDIPAEYMGNIFGSFDANIKKIERILSKNKRNLLFFTMGTNCGLRISDILSLNVGDVKNKNYIQLIEKKTGKPCIPLRA